MQLPLVIGSFVKAGFNLIFIAISNDFIYFIYGFLVGEGITIFLNVILLSRKVRLARPSRRLIKEYLSDASPLIFPTFLELNSANLGVLIFLFYHDESLLAIYFIFQTVITTINLLPDAFGVIFFSTVANLKISQVKEELNKRISIVEKYLMIFYMVPLIILVIYGDYVIGLIFPGFYVQGWFFLVLFYIQTVLFGMRTPTSYILLGLRQYKAFSKYALMQFVITLISWIFLIPGFGLIGIGAGSILGELMTNIYVRIKIKRLTLIEFDRRSLLLIITCTLLTLSFFFIRFFTILNLVNVILANIILEGMFFFYLVVAKIITRQDLNILKKALSFKEMLKYLTREIKSSGNTSE